MFVLEICFVHRCVRFGCETPTSLVHSHELDSWREADADRDRSRCRDSTPFEVYSETSYPVHYCKHAAKRETETDEHRRETESKTELAVF